MRAASTLIGLGILSALILTACAGQAGQNAEGGVSAQPEAGGTLRVLSSSEFTHLDPAQSFDTGTGNLNRLLYRTLTVTNGGDADAPGDVVPDLATDLGTPNADATEWTFTLREGVKFENGEPITSADVKFGVERSMDPALSTGAPYAKTLIKGADDYDGVYVDGPLDSIRTPDDRTIVFTLNQPYPEFGSAVSTPVFTPFPADGDVTTTNMDEQPIASGPYRVEAYERGSGLTLVRNEHWDADTDDVRGAYPDRFEWTFGLDAATIDERLLAGQGEDRNAIAGAIQPGTVARLSEPGIEERTVEGFTGCIHFAYLNTTKAPLDKLEVRQAISYALDRESAQSAAGGSLFGEVATTYLPPTMSDQYREYDRYPSDGHAGDLEKAKDLLEAAGKQDGMSLTLDTYSLPVMQKISESVQESLGKVGIDVELNVIDPARYFDTINTPELQSDLAIAGWCPDWNSGLTFLPNLFDGDLIFEKGNHNVSQLDDPAINSRIDEIAAMTDVAEANAAWGELDEQIAELAPAVPLFYNRLVTVAGENVSGAHSHPGLGGAIDLSAVGLTAPEG